MTKTCLARSMSTSVCLRSGRESIRRNLYEDVCKVFSCTTGVFMEKIFSGEVRFGDDDVTLELSEASHFSRTNRVFSIETFQSSWNESDLPRMVGRFAETAARRIEHLEKHPEKTDSEIRM